MQNSFQMDQMNRPLDFKSVDDAYIQALQEEFSMDEESCDEDSDPNIMSNIKLENFGLEKAPNNFNNMSQVNNNKKTPPPKGKKTKGRVKIKMEFIDNKLRRYTTFSKRKTGIMKKAYELSTLTGTEVMLLVASETGHVYTFATRKLQPMITSETGKSLIQTCLNSPDLPAASSDQRMSATGFEETDFTYSVVQDDQ
ncbi:SRF, partial [Cordylochernes scorpioides]